MKRAPPPQTGLVTHHHEEPVRMPVAVDLAGINTYDQTIHQGELVLSHAVLHHRP